MRTLSAFCAKYADIFRYQLKDGFRYGKIICNLSIRRKTMPTCPNCKTEVLAGYAFCMECGMELPETARNAGATSAANRRSGNDTTEVI